MQLTKIFSLRRKSSFRIEGYKYANISTVTERSFAKNWGISTTLILPRSSMWKYVKKSKHLRLLKYFTRFTKIERTKQY